MNFNICTAKISVAFKIIVFFYTGMFHYFFLIYISYICIDVIACTNNGSKIKLSTNRGHITFPWIWGLTGITCTEKEHYKLIESTLKQTIMYSCFNDFLWLSKYEMLRAYTIYWLLHLINVHIKKNIDSNSSNRFTKGRKSLT
jgi:hypothetical protein